MNSFVWHSFRRWGTSLAFLVLVVTGCTVITSKPSSKAIQSSEVCAAAKVPSGTQEKIPDGVGYFLPMVKVHVSIDLTNGVNPALTQVVTNWIITNSSATILLSTNGIDYKTTSVMVGTNSVVMPGGGVTNYYYVATYQAVIIQDPARHYILKNHHNIFYDDAGAVSVDNNHFLSSLNASNADQTANIISSIGQTALQIAKGYGLTPDFTPAIPTHYDLYFDPADDASVMAANSELTGYKIKITCDNTLPETTVSSYEQVEAQPIDGVVYRQPVPYLLTITANIGQPTQSHQSYLMSVPNRAPLYRISVHRGAFVTRTASLQFTNGFLASSAYLKPSEVNGFVQIPLTLATATVNIVTNLIPNKISLINSEIALHTATTNWIQVNSTSTTTNASH